MRKIIIIWYNYTLISANYALIIYKLYYKFFKFNMWKLIFLL